MAVADTSVVLITGATSGIGRSVAHRFAAHDWRVGLLDSDESAVRELEDELDAPSVFSRGVDLADEAAAQDAVAAFGDNTDGRLDVLVNAAGWMLSGRFEQLELDAHRKLIDGNLWAMLAVTHAAFPLLRDTNRSRVISIASASSMYGTPDLASYSAAKAGVRSLTQALNLEWAHYGIHVCDVVPPYVDAPAGDATAEDVVDVVEEAVTEDRIHWPVGKQFRWIYRLSDVLPASLVRLLMRYVSGF